MAHTQQKCVCEWEIMFTCLLQVKRNIDSKTLRFKNQPHMTFDDVAKSSDQEFNLAQDPNGNIEYAAK